MKRNLPKVCLDQKVAPLKENLQQTCFEEITWILFWKYFFEMSFANHWLFITRQKLEINLKSFIFSLCTVVTTDLLPSFHVFMICQLFCFEFIYPKGISEADNMHNGGKSAPKQVSGSPPITKPRESRKGPETEMAGEYPDGTPSRPRSSTPQKCQEKPGHESGITAGIHKVYFNINMITFSIFKLWYLALVSVST